jgi:Ca2+-binding RTX toxin-like protein
MATIEGSSGSEILFNWFNSSEDDYIDGLGGNDTVLGYGGNDTLIGNEGSTDWLYGGEGADEFILYTSNDMTAYLEGLWVNGQYIPPHVVDNISGTVHYLADYSAADRSSPDTIIFDNASPISPVNIQLFDANGNPVYNELPPISFPDPIIVNPGGSFDYFSGATDFQIPDSGDDWDVIDLGNIFTGGDDLSVIGSDNIFNRDVLTTVSDINPIVLGF